jgi:hypothetical protein
MGTFRSECQRGASMRKGHSLKDVAAAGGWHEVAIAMRRRVNAWCAGRSSAGMAPISQAKREAIGSNLHRAWGKAQRLMVEL